MKKSAENALRVRSLAEFTLSEGEGLGMTL